MKSTKFFLIILIFLFVFSFSCKKKNDKEENNNADTKIEDNSKEPDEQKIEPEDQQPKLEIIGPNILYIGDKYTYSLEKDPLLDGKMVSWSISDLKMARISPRGVVTPLKPGKCLISVEIEEFTKEIEVEIRYKSIESINIVDELKVEVGSHYELEYEFEPIDAVDDLYIINNDDKISINEKELSFEKIGNSTILIKSLSNENFEKTIKIEIVENKNPEFIKKDDYSTLLDVNYADKSQLLQGLEVIDNCDGDLSDALEYDEKLLEEYGEKDIILTVKDKAGNSASFTRRINVIWGYHTKFIGHAGCTFAVPNTEEAFLYAAKVLKYQAIECDVQVTKDGIYVCSHDSTIDDLVINEYTYDELKDITLKYSTYTGKLCTLDRYLEICLEYNCTPIIELKGSAPGLSSYSQDKIPEFMEYLKTKGAYDKSVILTSIDLLLIRIRKEGYDIRCQYLVNSCESNTVLNFCKLYNCDLSTNVTYGGPNGDEWLAKYKEAGLQISVWTFSGAYNQVQTWIDKGVDYVTCDCHIMSLLELK